MSLLFPLGEPEGEQYRNNLPHDDHCLHHDVAPPSDQVPSGKRPRAADIAPKIRTGESRVWQHFAKIFIEVPRETGSKQKDCCRLVYAVCHNCDKVFRASPKNGTSSLRRRGILPVQAHASDLKLGVLFPFSPVSKGELGG